MDAKTTAGDGGPRRFAARDERPFDRFDDSIAGDVRDPYPELAETRRRTPVQHVPGDPGWPDTYIFYRHADVTQVLRDAESFSSSVLKEVMGPVMGEHIILGMDAPEHRRHRALVSAAFQAKALQRFEQELVAKVVSELIDAFEDHGRAELVRQFTFLFPIRVIARILGLPPEDHADFQRWTVAIVGAQGNWEGGLEASKELAEYLAPILEERRARPADDLISQLAQAEIDGDRLSDEEIFSFVRLLLPAGAETTYRSSGNLIYLLLSHPDQLEAVRRDRQLVPQAIEEALRLEPPLLITSRLCVRDAEVGGTRVPAGSQVVVMLGSANRDEERYPDPDRFDVFRQPQPHVSFGHGPHLCLGMHLARLETKVALNALLDRLPGLRLDPEGDDPHIHGQIFRSPTCLPVLFG
jgi:cytochrome P450